MDREQSINIMSQVLESLGKDYLSISLIETNTRTVYPLKSSRRSVSLQGGEYPAFAYEDIAGRSVEKYVPSDKREDYARKTSLDTVVQELENKAEYSFAYEALIRIAMWIKLSTMSKKRHSTQRKNVCVPSKPTR